MPKFLERKLKKTAKAKGLSKERQGAYIYGTMNKLGMMKGNKITAKGRAAEKKHLARVKPKAKKNI